MFIPGQLVTLLTFPGVVMHEITHRFMCDVLGISVYDINYFSINNSRAGYVYHHKTDTVIQSLLIGFAPLLINSFFCMLFTLPYSSSLSVTGDGISYYGSMLLWWVGMSMGINAFPSNQDVDNVLTTVEEQNIHIVIHQLCFLICGLMKFFNCLRFVFLDVVYAFVISFILPYFIFGQCAYLVLVAK